MSEVARVLVVDDEEAARYGITRALAGEAYELREAADGSAALHTIATFRPDVVVSDINMPGMDGITLVRQFQGREDAPLIVLITAYGSERVAIQALRAGAYDYLAKPFELDELRAIVRNAVEKQRLLRENRYYVAELARALKDLRQSQAARIQAEKMACLGRVVSGIAHEINNPLGALQSGMDLVERGVQRLQSALPEGPGGETRHVLEAMSAGTSAAQTACARIGGIVQNLSRFVQLDRADMQPADLHEGLDSTLTLLGHELGPDIEVRKEYGELPRVECNLRELNQVFLNLLLNAKEAIERNRRPGVITVRTRADGSCVAVEIEDTGCGIPAGHLQDLLGPTLVSKGGRIGMGLGLPICYQITRSHQGRIEMASVEGAGSTFRVVLPIHRAADVCS